jgi:AAA+ ATPase superfamily predicted ATPase
MDPIEAYSLFQLGKLSSDKIVSLANLWLENNIFADSLVHLFGISRPIMSDVAPLFEKAMKELNVHKPTSLEAAKILIKITLRKIVENKLDPVEGASFLYGEIYHTLTNEIPNKNYVGDNLGLEHIFCWLREIWDCRDGSRLLYYSDLPRSEAEVKFIEHLVEEAERWLKGETEILGSSDSAEP